MTSEVLIRISGFVKLLRLDRILLTSEQVPQKVSHGLSLSASWYVALATLGAAALEVQRMVVSLTKAALWGTRLTIHRGGGSPASPGLQR